MNKKGLQLLPYDSEDTLEIGIDEAGRGCLIGRVYIAGVILPSDFKELCEENDIIIKDSKKMSAKNKEKSRIFIENNALDYAIVYKENDRIDDINIFQATMEGMHDVIDKITIKPEKILVDGNYFRTYKDYSNKNKVIEHKCVVKGDDTYMSIASASILAKTYKDEYIKDLVEEHPELYKYDLLNNSGYGTQNHIEAIKIYGISNFHRKTFGICKNY